MNAPRLGFLCCVLIALAVGCGDGSPSSPVAPGGPSAGLRLQGAVLDIGGRPLADAVVTIIDGRLAGTETRTDGVGKFEFRGGSPGAVTLRASRDGFRTQVRTMTWIAENVTRLGYDIVFQLDSIEPPIGLEPGLYTLTVTADVANGRDWSARPDASCAGFPTEFASRSYRAEIRAATQPRFSVTADDPTLRWRDLFSFYVSGTFVGFEMEGGAGAGLYEDFPGFRHLEIGGFSSPSEPGTRDGASVSVPFQGAVSYCRLKSARGVNDDCYQVPTDQVLEFHVCISDHNRLTFTRR